MLLESSTNGESPELPGNRDANKLLILSLTEGRDNQTAAPGASASTNSHDGFATGPAGEDMLLDGQQSGATDSPKDEDEDYEAYLLDHSDIEDVPIKPLLPSEGCWKKMANRAAFGQYLVDHEEEGDKISDEQDDDPKRLQSLTARKLSEESAKIIDKARDYQQELFERAKEENIIAVLDTGSGKTLIACLLIKHILTQEVIDRKEGKPPRTVVFLVNSVHLVIQQGQVLSENLAQPPKVLHGSVKEDLWKKQTWNSVIEDYRAVVCTAEVLNQALFHNYISIDAISLLIFDECHHTKKGHPYARIMLDYYMRPSASQRRPKIFGMTASPMDTRGDMRKASGDLETLLQQQICLYLSMHRELRTTCGSMTDHGMNSTRH